jgi:hypothetical protein
MAGMLGARRAPPPLCAGLFNFIVHIGGARQLVERQNVCGCAFDVANERAAASPSRCSRAAMLMALMGGKRMKSERTRLCVHFSRRIFRLRNRPSY